MHFADAVLADVSPAYRRSAQAKAISAGLRWPACLGTQRRSRPFGFLHDFAMVERSEFARLAENTAVHDDGVDIARLRQRDKRLVGVADRCHIDIRGADQDDVSPLAGRERASFLGDAEVNRAVERGELNQAFYRNGYLVADPVLM